MASTRKPTPRPRQKPLSDIGKRQMKHEDLEMMAPVGDCDSGLGSMQSMPSDRNCTGSDSMDDTSRDQRCSETLALTKRVEHLRIDAKHTSNDDGYSSMENKENQESLPSETDGKVINNFNASAYVTILQFIQSYAVTNDVRYLLAPYLGYLVDQNEDGDT